MSPIWTSTKLVNIETMMSKYYFALRNSEEICHSIMESWRNNYK